MQKILIVVDMQNDFIDGALGTKEAEAVVGKVAAKIVEYNPDSIYVTRDTHGEDYLATAEGKGLPVPHCIKGTDGWELHARIKAALTNPVIIDKPTFGSYELTERIAALWESDKAMEIELVGLCTDICVVSNALLLKARLPEVPIRVDGACCAGVTPESHEAALLTMKMCQIIVA